MVAGRKRSCLGGTLLVLSSIFAALLLCSGRWTLSLRSPADRWRVSLGADFFGGGVLSLDAIRDPTARFALDFRAAQRRPGPWSLEWRLSRMQINPVMVDPAG